MTELSRPAGPDPASPLPDATVVDRLRASYAVHESRTALRDDERALTYAELGAQVRAAASALRALGVARGERVAVTPTRSIDQVVCTLAALDAGATVVVADLTQADRGAWVMSAAQPKVVLAADSALTAIPRAEPFGALINRPALSDDRPRSAPGSRDLAYVLPTSGTTGRPKLVAMPHAPLAHRIAWAQDAYPLDGEDVVLHAGSLAFDFSLWEILAPLCSGATVAVAPEHAEAEPVELAAFIASTGTTVAHFVPSLLAEFLTRTGGHALAGLRVLLLGGERLTSNLARRVRAVTGARLYNQYGPTEACIDVFSHELTPEDLAAGGVPIGRPVAGVTAAVADEDGRPVRDGEPGLLRITGTCLAWGYLGAGASTAAAFRPAAGGAPGQRWYETGDRVVRRPDGVFEFLGRLDRQLKIRGVRIELAEIEEVLAGHPAVAHAVVVAVRCPDGTGSDLVAHVVADDGLTTTELRSRLLDRLVPAAVPAHYLLRSHLPMLPNGKTDREALVAEGLPQQRDPVTDEGLSTETERRLAVLFGELLGTGQIHRATDFFRSGGHSLLAMRLIARVRKQLGSPVSARAIFDHPTLAQFAAYVDRTNAVTNGMDHG
ncbi:non-ribosomal peptide synthetase [Micromonospora sp. DT4]|uniref:non-ribosomal peptide synthetase n=1 Tax=Micromonospora sp. DT4 TaxID=3393438 RepID=UPI003CEEAD4F